jgi:type III secretion system-like peptide-binding chaperone
VPAGRWIRGSPPPQYAFRHRHTITGGRGSCAEVVASGRTISAVTRIDVIRPFVEQTVREFLGVDELKVMEDGTIPIRSGSAAIHVRLIQEAPDDHPLLQIFSPLLSDIEATPALMAKLNEMNSGLSFARAFWAGGQVILAMDLLAEELDKEQIEHACGLVTFAADYWDTELQKGFGGTVGVSEDAETDAAGADDDGGGYL